MKRYFTLYLYFLRFSFSKALEFRIDFTFRILMDTIYYIVNITFFKVLYMHTPLLGGWTEDQSMIFVASFLLVDAINMTVFSTNMWWLPYFINKGELDYYLIRPVSPLFFLSLREFSANSFLNLIMALSFMGYCLATYSMSFSFWDVVLFLSLIINGTLIYHWLHMLMVLPVFWTQSSKGFVDLFYTMGIAMERPHKIYKGWLRILFTVVLPFGLIASYPAQVFLEKVTLASFIQLVLVSVGLWLVVLYIWDKGLKTYSSASS